MLFNSFEFLLFLPCAFAAYWMLSKHWRVQNLFTVAASWLFYGWWDARFLVLIAFTSAWSWTAGAIELKRWDRRPSKTVLWISLAVNLGILAYFKYCNFFIESFFALAKSAGFECAKQGYGLEIVLPVGVSFYTFQALSYTIDVYRRKIRPVRDPVAFFAFISFFPQLVAGPIERAADLLPQFTRPRTFDCAQAIDGCRQMLWGFFKKCVVADSCAVVANHLLNGPDASNGLGAWLGSLMFAIQIYGDFSGYSDIAIGCSRLFGINLRRNFAFPYFSRDIAEFWRRWHISLTTWFRDYLYIPLGGSRCGKLRQIRNTFAIFLVSGLWHGANWTFILWGAFHAALFLPLLLSGRNRKNLDTPASGSILPSGAELWRMAATFFLATLGWTIFRAPSVSEAANWFAAMFNPASFAPLHGLPRETAAAAAATAIMFAAEWTQRGCRHALERMPRPAALRYAIYYALAWVVLFYTPSMQTFIYFQF